MVNIPHIAKVCGDNVMAESHLTDWRGRVQNSGPLCIRQMLYPLHHSSSFYALTV